MPHPRWTPALLLLALGAGCASMEPAWELFPARGREEVFKAAVSVVAERYDLAVLREGERSLRTEWKGLPAPLREGRRRRVELRVVDDEATGAPLLLVTAERQVHRGSTDARTPDPTAWTPDGRDGDEERLLIQCVKSTLFLGGPGAGGAPAEGTREDLWKDGPREPGGGDPWGDLASRRRGD